METTLNTPVLDRLVSPLSDCLTPESAKRLLAMKADPELQTKMDEMASRHTEGRLTASEQADYGRYVSFATFIAILKSKARQILAASHGE